MANDDTICETLRDSFHIPPLIGYISSSPKYGINKQERIGGLSQKSIPKKLLDQSSHEIFLLQE